MACKIKFKNSELNEDQLKEYFENLKASRGSRTGLSFEEYQEIERVMGMATFESASLAQKFAIHKMIENHLKIKPVGDTHYTMDGEELMRMSNAIDGIDEFTFDGDDSLYEVNRQWGNAINEIFDMAMSGKPISDFKSTYIDPAVAEQLYNQFQSYDFGPGAKVLTQVRLATITTDKDGKPYRNKEGKEFAGVAGTADIIVVDKDGVVRVLDLKSSINPTAKPYSKVKGGITYVNEYGKRVLKNKASKKERHAIQLSGYYYMLKNMGFNMAEKKPIGVLPVHITSTRGDTIASHELEPLIDDHAIDVRFSNLDKSTNNKKAEALLVKIKMMLGKQLQKAENEGKPTFFINNILEAIKGVDSAIAVQEFVDEIFKNMYGSPSFRGQQERLEYLITNYNTSTDPQQKQEYISQIQAIKENIDSLLENDIMKELKMLAMTEKYDDGSTLKKVKRMIDDMEVMKEQYDDVMLDMIADTLAQQVTPEMLENMAKGVKDLDIQLDVLRQRYAAKPKDRLKRRIENLEKKIEGEKKRLFMDADYNIDYKQMLIAEIKKGGYKDPSFLDRLFTPVTSIDNSFLPTFALTIKQAFEEVRRKLIDKTKDMQEGFNAFLNGRSLLGNPPEELYKDFQTDIEVEGKKVLSAITYMDWNKFLSAKKKAQQSFKDKYGYGSKDYVNAMEEWYANNTEERPADDIVFNGLTVLEGKTTIMNRKKKQLSSKAYKAWLDNEPFELRMPKESMYKDARFDKIKDNQWYIKLMKTLQEAQKMLPPRRFEYENFILPFIPKSNVDKFREQVIKEGNLKEYMAYEIRDAVSLTKEDYNADNYDKNSSETKSIPVMYYNRDAMMESSEVTKDMYLSIMKFYDAAMKYQVQSKYRIIGDNLLGFVQKEKPALTDYSGAKILSRVAKMVGLDKTLDDYVKKNTNNVAAMLEMFIDVTIYGRTKYNETVKLGLINKTIDMGKVADTIMSIGSMTQIALNPLLYVANTLQGNAANMIDGSANGLWKSTATWAKAKKLYYWDGGLGGISDTFLPDVKTKLNLLAERYDPIQGDFYNTFGQKMSRSAANRMFRTSSGFALSHIAEHQIQVQGMIAQMLETPVKQVIDGVETTINLFDAYEVVNGELKYKEGVIPVDDNRFMNIMHAKNKRLHGIYNSFDVVELNRSSIGRLILFYRKFLPAGLKYRFKNRGFDYELGDYTYGIYRAFYSKLFFETGEVIRSLRGLDSTLTDLEKRSLLKAAMEHLLLFGTGLLTIILASLKEGADDEDEKLRYSYALYFVMRLNAELSIYGGISDPKNPFLPNLEQMISPFYTPTAALGVVRKAFRLYSYVAGDVLNLLSGEDIARYQREEGQFEKGTSKSYAALVKLLGFNKNLMDIDSALEQLELTKGIQ